MKILLKTLVLTALLSGCAANKAIKIEEKETQLKDFLIKKELKDNIVNVSIYSKSEKTCSIFLNKRVIELEKEVKGDFVKKVKLKKNENKEDIVVKCN